MVYSRSQTLWIAAVAAIALSTSVALFSQVAQADSTVIDFENPPYVLGNINSQDGWSKTGGYDAEVVANTYGYASFGDQSLRISNAVTSGSFGDQVFSKSLTDEAGETTAENGGLSGGTRQVYFEAQWDFASTVPGSEQSGLSVVASPDRGDGARMSWIEMADTPSGLEVNFYDYVTGVVDPDSCCTGFRYDTIASGLDRTVPHTIRVTMEFVEGPANDIVKVYVDGTLVHTGTSWEDYFRDFQGPNTRTVDSVLFRVSGTAAPGTSGEGFLIDNLSLTSGSVPTYTVSIAKYVDGVHATALNANSTAFPMESNWDASNIGAGSGNYTLSPTGFNTAEPYEAVTSEMTQGADYSTFEVPDDVAVGGDCDAGAPFALAGYTTGSSWAEAAGGSPSFATPTFTDMQEDKYVIVWNVTCPDVPSGNEEDHSIEVENTNSAFIFNRTVSRSSTGWNFAGGATGGDGGDAGEGGDVEVDEESSLNANGSGSASAGNGGAGGRGADGGLGGMIRTGNASSFSESLIFTNRNFTRIR